MKLPPVGYAQRAGEVMASQLGKIGIKLSIVQLEWPQWLAEVFKERNYELTIVAHTEANDIDRYARDGYYWNYHSDRSSAGDREIGPTTDQAKRVELLKQAQRIIAKDAVNGFLFELAKIGVWNKDLIGMWENSPTPSDRSDRSLLEVTLLHAAAGGLLPSARFLSALESPACSSSSPPPRPPRCSRWCWRSLVVFAVLEVLPGDPALVMLGNEAQPDTLAALRKELGLDQPVGGPLLQLDRRPADLRFRQQPRLQDRVATS